MNNVRSSGTSRIATVLEIFILAIFLWLLYSFETNIERKQTKKIEALEQKILETQLTTCKIGDQLIKTTDAVILLASGAIILNKMANSQTEIDYNKPAEEIDIESLKAQEKSDIEYLREQEKLTEVKEEL